MQDIAGRCCDLNNAAIAAPFHRDQGAAQVVLARVAVLTQFVMEGGYALDALGANAANILTGYLDH